MTEQQHDEKNPIPEEHKRSIRSLALWQGHITAAQQRTIDTLWLRFDIGYCQQTVDLNARFGRGNPKVLEIGFGMGTIAVETAERLLGASFLAVDVHGPGVDNLLELAEEGYLGNIRIMRHDAVKVVEGMLANAPLDGIHIFFPDLWHKKRRNKRRLVQAPLITELLPKLKSDDYIHIATGWGEYVAQILEVLGDFAELQDTVDGYMPTPGCRPKTKFETRGRRLGYDVWDLVFEKIRQTVPNGLFLFSKQRQVVWKLFFAVFDRAIL